MNKELKGNMKNTIKPITYAEEYHEDKPSIFRESENLDRLLQAIFDVCYQQQLDFLWLSQNLLNVDVAEKSHLDFIGNIVGQPRFLSDFNTEPYFGYEGSYQSKPFSSVTNPDIGGFWNSRSHFNTATARQLNDDEYRRLIKARAIYNQSNCTANDLLEVVNLITDSDDNTVQLLKHGLIQIKTSDKTGILSYFVDRLYLEDNILPIAAGVRVGLEEVVRNSGDGDTGDGDTGGDWGGDWGSLPNQSTVRIINKEGNFNNTHMYFSVEINGVLYNAEKLDLGNYNNLSAELRDLISFYLDSGGVMYVGANVSDTELKVRLSPSEEQKVYSKDFYTSPWDENPTPQGVVLPNGDFIFRLYKESGDR